MNEEETDIDIKLCSDIAKFCNDSTGEDYNLEDEEDEVEAEDNSRNEL